VFGVGLGNSLTKNTGLPFGWTDSVFAVLVEEAGLIGGLVVIALYGLILWRGLRIAERTPDFLGKLLASGVTLWITLEALLNIAVLFGLLPFTGNALPFLSYGGSSLITIFAGIGLLLNVNRIGMQDSGTSGGKTFGAVVDLRWRDGRRRVSRTVRAASPRG
ncbi:FtsW/RodA/SpoVE family cell cycle protein, partial [Levilinea saccharolytica]